MATSQLDLVVLDWWLTEEAEQRLGVQAAPVQRKNINRVTGPYLAIRSLNESRPLQRHQSLFFTRPNFRRAA